MKRKLSLLLCLIMIMSMAAGCTQQNETPPSAGNDTESNPKAMMAPGTYTAEVYGFSMSWPDILEVKVSENEIESIAFDEESGSTASMIDAVAAAMFPRILESQSINVDMVTGATVTSNAARLAIENCIKQALAEAGSEESAIDIFKKTNEKSGGSKELKTQVLVIGMGGSGTYTALRAAEEGADVLVIEKQGRYGGTTALTSEIQSINPPRVQEKYNNGEDFTDADAMYQAWTEYTEGDAKKEMLDLYFENSGPAFDWLALDHGARFDFDPKPGFTPQDWYKVKFQWYPNTHPDHPDAPTHGYNKREIASYFDKLVKDFTDLGGKYMLETEAYELITDETGGVVGAKAKNRMDGIEYTIKADAVVIATGGFLGSSEMTSKYLSNEYYPLKGTWKIYGTYGNDGKMIQSAMDIGAATYNIGMPPEVHMSGSAMFIPHSYGFPINKVEGQKSFNTGKQSVWSVADLPMFLGITPDSLAVNVSGERFTAETGVAMLDPWLAGPNFYSIWSSDQINDVRDNGFKHFLGGVSSGFLGYTGDIPVNTPLPETYDVLDAGMEMGFIFKGDTIEELAKAIDIDSSALKNTVETYNNYCAKGKDEQFNKDAQYLETIGQGPYYAIKMASYSYNTCAGLDVNTSLQVLDTAGKPIEGLFCVGSDCAGVLFTEKRPYVTYGGANNGWVLTSAYVCGEAVANYVNNK